MPLPVSFFRGHAFTEPPAMVRVVARADVMWNRPIFKAPPLNVQSPVAGAKPFEKSLRKSPAVIAKPAK